MELDLSNDPEIERLGANATAQHAIQFWNTLSEAARRDGRLLDPVWQSDSTGDESAHYTKLIVLTTSKQEDYKLYRRFRSNFGGLNVVDLKSSDTCRPLGGEKWASLLLASEGTVEDYNFMTLLREDAYDMFWMSEFEVCDGMAICPRAQFVFIEVARIHEGVYGTEFRKRLQVFDLKTQADKLVEALQEDNVQKTKRALLLLQTQWPNPSKRALQASGVLQAVRFGAKSAIFDLDIQKGCLDVLQYWQDLVEMGRIQRNAAEKYAPTLERALRALMNSSNSDNGDASRNGNKNKMRMPAVTQTTSLLQDVVVENKQDASSNMFAGNTSKNSNDGTSIFSKFGVCVLKNVLDSDEVEACQEHAKASLESLVEEQLKPRGLQVDGENSFDFAEARQRPGHRVDNRYKILDSPSKPIARLAQKLQDSILPQLVNMNSFKLLYGGVVHSFPNSTEPQMWHRDGPSLFDKAAHHDTHCFNVFVPLVNVSVENGTTEFVPGTHNDEVFEKIMPELLAQGDAKHPLAIRAKVPVGTVICFDIRVLHRGMANPSNQERPVLYFTFAKDWFVEHHFFEKEKSLVAASKAQVKRESQKQLVANLYKLVTGQSPPTDTEYGHVHYTTRFDLLLLEGLLSASETPQHVDAINNMAAVMAFVATFEAEKIIMASELVELLGNSKQRKLEALAQAKAARREAKQAVEEEVDFASIDTDMSDVATLYSLTVDILLGESPHLSKLGFSKNENGLCVMLAVLKAYTTHHDGDIVSCAELEEAFTSWWHAGVDRFEFRYDSVTENGDEKNKSVLVVFSSLGSGIARPEWGGSLRNVAPSVDLDVLHVLDPAFSWYNQDPCCQWNGGEYYLAELTKLVADYKQVMFLGDSMGGAAALLFSAIANVVLAFTPQVDITSYDAITRLDFPTSVRQSFHDRVVDVVKTTKADIFIHFGRHCEEDTTQIALLPERPNVHLIEHDYDDHILSLHLRDQGELQDLVEDTVNKFLARTK